MLKDTPFFSQAHELSLLPAHRIAKLPFRFDFYLSHTPGRINTGFIANEKTFEVYGRPVGVALWRDGSLLVADDSGKRVWRVRAVRSP
jgi:glucose/arabinose dehydrogenase